MTRCDNIEGKLRDALVLLRGDLSRLSKEVNGVRDMLALKALSRDADDLSILLNEYFQWVDARLKDMQPDPETARIAREQVRNGEGMSSDEYLADIQKADGTARSH